MPRPIALAACLTLATPLATPGHALPPEPPAPLTIVQRLRIEAEAVAPLVQTPLARAFLSATAGLAEPPARTLYRDPETHRYLPASAAAALDDEQRAALREVELDADRFYTTKYGTPIAYARLVDLLGAHGVESLEGKRLLDFGYGTIGHLRLLGSLGAECVGVDVDSFLTALYGEPGDQGPVGGGPGSVRLVEGRWPSTAEARQAVGGGFDVFISKNTLKRGYIHPAREVDERMTITLGVDDEAYCRALWTALKPGGLAVIYNICPAPAPPDEPYIPWADGRCPFDRQLLERMGFEVLAFDVDDSPTTRDMARALGWDRGERPMDVESDLFGTYTVLRRPAEGPSPRS